MEIATDSVGRRRLKNHLSEVLRETVSRGQAVPITNHGSIDAYLVPPKVAIELEDAARLREALPLLMAAVASGAAIPSKTLGDLGIEIPFDWRELNRFVSKAPVDFTQGEDGESWALMPDSRPEAVAEEEVDFEL